MTAPTPAPVGFFEPVDRLADLDAPSAGLLPSLGFSPFASGAGAAWLPDVLGTYQIVDPCDDPPDFPADGPRPRLVLAAPTTLRTSYWWQGRPQDLDEEAAERYITAVTSAAVARELWSGEATQAAPYGVPEAYGGGERINDYLANPATCAVAGGTPLHPRDAIAVLDGLGIRALRGSITPVIHVTPEVVQAAADFLTRSGTTLRTINGSVVVADAGATGEGPGDRAGLWGYVTGPVGVWVSSISSINDRTQTTITARNYRQVWANRTFRVGFDPTCHIAVPIDYALPTLTQPGG